MHHKPHTEMQLPDETSVTAGPFLVGQQLCSRLREDRRPRCSEGSCDILRSRDQPPLLSNWQAYHASGFTDFVAKHPAPSLLFQELTSSCWQMSRLAICIIAHPRKSPQVGARAADSRGMLMITTAAALHTMVDSTDPHARFPTVLPAGGNNMWEFWGLPDATGEALVKVGDMFLPGRCQQPQHAANRIQRHVLNPCAARGMFTQGIGL